MVTDAGLRAALTTGLDTPVSPRAEELIAYITQAFGPSTAAIIHYGSRAQKSGSRPDSAYDFFVIVDDYEPAFLSFAARVRPSWPVSAGRIHVCSASAAGRRAPG